MITEKEEEKVIVTEIDNFIQRFDVPEDFFSQIQTLPICAAAPLLMFYINALKTGKDVQRVVLLYKLYQVMLNIYNKNSIGEAHGAYICSMMFSTACLPPKTTAWADYEVLYKKEESKGERPASYLLNKHRDIVQEITGILPEVTSTTLLDYFYWEVEYLLSDYADDLNVFYDSRHKNSWGDYLYSEKRDYYNSRYRFKLPKHQTLLGLELPSDDLFEELFFPYFCQ